MSKNEEKVSVEELRSKENNLYDFLYNDTRRIASFLSQVNELGYLQQVRESELSGSGVKQTAEGKVVAKTSQFIEAGGEGGFKVAPYEKEELNLERTYDPLWIHAVNFLNYLENKKLLEKDILQANIGQFVEISGQVHLIDFESFKESFISPEIYQAAGIIKKKEQQLFSKVMASLPFSLQGHLVNNTKNIWFTLDKMFLTGQASDLLMKYGLTLKGAWNIIGILDVKPNEDVSNQSIEFSRNGLWDLFTEIIPPIRSTMGRPDNVASVTPLLIYREISK